MAALPTRRVPLPGARAAVAACQSTTNTTKDRNHALG
jgi:hypothetical protein